MKAAKERDQVSLAVTWVVCAEGLRAALLSLRTFAMSLSVCPSVVFPHVSGRQPQACGRKSGSNFTNSQTEHHLFRAAGERGLLDLAPLLFAIIWQVLLRAAARLRR